MSLRSMTHDSRLLLALTVAVTLAGCQKKEEPAAESATTTGAAAVSDALEGQVDIVAWPGYIERGANDPAYDWVTAFEQATGCKVTVKDAATSDEMVSLMSSGGYDLVTASGDSSLRMVYGNVVQPIDISKIPSYNNNVSTIIYCN